MEVKNYQRYRIILKDKKIESIEMNGEKSKFPKKRVWIVSKQ